MSARNWYKWKQFPIKRLPNTDERRRCFDVNKDGFVLQEQLSKGAYGKVLSVCKGDSERGVDRTVKQCPYVAKEVEVKSPLQWEMLQMEINVSVRAGRMEYGPTVHQVYVCNRGRTMYVYIIMDRWHGDLEDLWWSMRERGVTIDAEFIQALLTPVVQMHKDGVFHQDCYLRNILYKRLKGPDGRDSLRFCVTDFGLSMPFRLKSWDLVTSSRSRKCTAKMGAMDLVTLFYGRLRYRNREMYFDNSIVPHGKHGYNRFLWETTIEFYQTHGLTLDRRAICNAVKARVYDVSRTECDPLREDPRDLRTKYSGLHRRPSILYDLYVECATKDAMELMRTPILDKRHQLYLTLFDVLTVERAGKGLDKGEHKSIMHLSKKHFFRPAEKKRQEWLDLISGKE
jgi:tRNA A-37 threonylcarbamoyl transferase component Bud32